MRDTMYVLVFVFVIMGGVLLLVKGITYTIDKNEREKNEMAKQNCKIEKIKKDAVDLKFIDGDCYLKAEDGMWIKAVPYYRFDD